MGLRHMVVMAFLAVCVCLPLAAQQVDNVTFNNSGGMLSGTGLNSGSLSLNSSTLSGISGFTGPLGAFDTTGSNLGTLSFTTGPLSSGSMVPLTGATSTFGAGGVLTVMETNGLTFAGSFASAAWQCATGFSCSGPKVVKGVTQWTGTWLFTGKLTNVVLTVNGQQIAINGAVTIQATTLGSKAATMAGGNISFTDNMGFTNFNMTVTPEPGTLALFGSGLIAVGALVKFSQHRKREL